MARRDFEAILSDARRLGAQHVRRVKIAFQVYSDRTRPADETGSTIEEFIPNGGYRSFTERTKGGKSTKNEVIITGSKYYERNGDGPWSVYNGNIGDDMSETPWDIEQTYWKFEKTKLDGKVITLYRSIIKFAKSRYKDDKTPETYTDQYWINDGGLLVKTSQDIEYVGTKKFRSRVSTYEYDPKDLKIEAPVK